MKKPSKGFVFGARALDNKTIVYINVCGHEDIQPPQGPSGCKVDEDYLDRYGVENIQIPIAVGNPVEVNPESSNNASKTSNNSNSKIQEVSPSTSAGSSKKPATKTAPAFKQIIVEVVIHKMLSERCRCVWNTGGNPKEFDEKVQPERKMVVFRITKLALDWVQRETGMMLQPESVRLMFHTAYQTPPTASHTSASATEGGNNKLPSPGEMMEFMKRMAEKSGGGAGDQQASSMEAMMKAAAAEGKRKEEEEQKTSSRNKNVLTGEEDRSSSIIFSATKNNSNNNTSAASEKSSAPPKPLVQEVSSLNTNKPSSSGSSVIKKGFLNSAKTSLYDEKGSSEGVLPDGAGDPIGYMPKAFRDKCKVVDMRKMDADNPEDVMKAMDAAKGTTISGKPISSSQQPSSMPQQQKQTPPAVEAPVPKKVDVKKEGESKITFSHQHQSPKKEEPTQQQQQTQKKSAITIEEVDSSNNNDNNNSFFCHKDWSLTSAKISELSPSITLTLKPPSSGTFSIGDLDLEVTSSGLKAQSEDNSSEVFFSLGSVDEECSSSFSVAEWKKMFPEAECALEGDGGSSKQKFQLDSDGAKAKFKKSSKELVLTIPLV